MYVHVMCSMSYVVSYLLSHNVKCSTIHYVLLLFSMSCVVSQLVSQCHAYTMSYYYLIIMSYVVSLSLSLVRTASSTVSQVAAQPERVVHMVEGNTRTTFGGGGGAKTENSAGGGGAKTITSAVGGGAYATKAWKDTALKVDIMGYVSNMELKNVELVSTGILSYDLICKTQYNGVFLEIHIIVFYVHTKTLFYSNTKSLL